MKNLLLWLILFVTCVFVVSTTHEPEDFRQLKVKYTEFIKGLPAEFSHLRSRSILTGTTRKGDLGSNVNKGYEISVCVDNNVNSMFHVLLHELAHNTVKEYAHSDEFWAQYNRLKDDAIARGFYTPIDPSIDFCGKKIKG